MTTPACHHCDKPVAYGTVQAGNVYHLGCTPSSIDKAKRLAAFGAEYPFLCPKCNGAGEVKERRHGFDQWAGPGYGEPYIHTSTCQLCIARGRLRTKPTPTEWRV